MQQHMQQQTQQQTQQRPVSWRHQPRESVLQQRREDRLTVLILLAVLLLGVAVLVWVPPR